MAPVYFAFRIHKIPGMWKDCLPSTIVILHKVQVKSLPGIQDLQKVFCVGLLGVFFGKHLSVNRGDHTHAAVSHHPWSDMPLNPCGLQPVLTTLLFESTESLLTLGKKNPQGIPQLIRSCPSKFKWRTGILGFRNRQTSGGKEKVYPLHWTRSPVFSRAVFQTKHSLKQEAERTAGESQPSFPNIGGFDNSGTRNSRWDRVVSVTIAILYQTQTTQGGILF